MSNHRELQEELDLEALKKACLKVLGAQFDSVQIVATRHTTEGTVCAAWGEGNVFARIASVEEYLRRVEDNDE